LRWFGFFCGVQLLLRYVAKVFLGVRPKVVCAVLNCRGQAYPNNWLQSDGIVLPAAFFG